MSSKKKKRHFSLIENTTKETEPFKNTLTSSTKPLPLGPQQRSQGPWPSPLFL